MPSDESCVARLSIAERALEKGNLASLPRKDIGTGNDDSHDALRKGNNQFPNSNNTPAEFADLMTTETTSKILEPKS